MEFLEMAVFPRRGMRQVRGDAVRIVDAMRLPQAYQTSAKLGMA